MTSFGSVAGTLSQFAAQAMPYVPCPPGLPGCGGPANVIAQYTIPQVALFFLRVAGGLSLIFIILAGVQMMLAWGDDSKISQQKKSILYAMIGLCLAIMSQGIVSAVATYNYAAGNPNDAVVGGLFYYITDIMLTFVNVIFVIMTLMVSARMVMAQGKTDEYNAARKGLLWIITGALFVNVSLTLVNGILTLFGV